MPVDISVDQTSWNSVVQRYLLENIHKKTLQADKDNLLKLTQYLEDKSLSQINMTTLRPFIQHRLQIDGVTNATINRALEVVRRILHLSRDEWLLIDRFPKIRMLPEPKRRIRFITTSEAQLLFNALPEHLEMVSRFALSTGCRMSEILSLEWTRVDIERKVAWLDHGTTKNSEGRGIPLNYNAIKILTLVKNQHSQYCFTYQGKRMSAIGSSWKRTLKKVRIEDFRFHDLRHTWASWHVQKGTSLQELMELGGWKSYDMVLRYAHLAPEHLSIAASRIEIPH